MRPYPSKHVSLAHRALWALIFVAVSASQLASAMTRVALAPTGIGRNNDLMGQAVALAKTRRSSELQARSLCLTWIQARQKFSALLAESGKAKAF